MMGYVGVDMLRSRVAQNPGVRVRSLIATNLKTRGAERHVLVLGSEMLYAGVY